MDFEQLLSEGKITKHLTSRNRVVYSGGIYHIVSRAPGKEILFISKKDYERFVQIVNKAIKKYQFEIYAYVLMRNHIHLLIKINDDNLALAMKYILECYAKYYNIKYERKGSVFSRPYRSSLCMSDDYLLAIVNYIHLNPVKAGLCERCETYLWSSASQYLVNSEGDIKVNKKNILEIIAKNTQDAVITMKKQLYEIIKIKYSLNINNKESFHQFFKKVLHIINMNSEIISVCNKLKGFQRAKGRVVSKEAKDERKYLIQQLISNGYTKRDICEILQISRMTLYVILK